MILSSKVMRADIPIPWLCVVVALLAVGSTQSEGLCERGHSWWDRQRGVCVPCTRCDPARHLAVHLPCEIHRDTVCQSLYNVRIWPFNVQNQYNDSDTVEYYDDVYYDSEVTDSEVGEQKWNLETSSLTLASSGCVVFFAVVLVLSIYHAKQWRALKHALKSDVHDLTAKLKLMEAGGETAAEPVVPTDHHIYCNIHAGKEALLGPTSGKKGLGNVYTQEKHPS